MENAMYYIALKAPDAVNEEVLKWKNFMRDRFGCVVALKSPAHITLISPFWMKTDLQPDLEKTIDDFSANQARFAVKLVNFDCFKPRVIFVHVENSEPLGLLKAVFETHLLKNSSAAIKRESRSFHPHITIANRDLRKKDFAEAWEYFRNKSYEATFLADGLTLMKHNGIKWDPVHTGLFPLA